LYKLYIIYNVNSLKKI